MKRMLSVLTAAAMLLGLTSCSPREHRNGATLEISFDHAYRAERCTAVEGDPFGEGDAYTHGGDLEAVVGHYALIHDGTHSPERMFALDLENGESRQLSMPYYEANDCAETIVVGSPVPLPDGGFLLMYKSITSDGRIEFSDGGHVVKPGYMERYDSELQLVEGFDLPDTVAPERSAFLRFVDADGYYYMSEYDKQFSLSMHVYAPDFTEAAALPVEADDFTDLVQLHDGTLLLSYQPSDDPEKRLVRIDRSTWQTEDFGFSMQAHGYPKICAGNGGHTFCYHNAEGYFGVREDGSEEMLVSWFNSDFDGDRISTAVMLPDGRCLVQEERQIAGAGHRYASFKEQWLLTKRTDREVRGMRLLSLAAVTDMPYELRELVIGYNRRSTDTRIVLVDYRQYSEEPWDNTTGIERLKADMLGGTVADIICTDNLPLDSLVSKGLLCDLSERLAQDEALSDETHLMNFLRSGQYGETLPHIGFSFRIRSLAALTQLAGDAQGLSVQAFTELADSMPEGMRLTADRSQEEALETLCINDLGSFVDLHAHTCSFDSAGFIRLLELCGSYPSAQEVQPDVMFSPERMLLYDCYLYEPYTWHETAEGAFRSEAFTMVGYPGTEGNGGLFLPDFRLGIYSQSSYADEAWAFFDWLLSEEGQYEMTNQMTMSLSPNLAVLRTSMEEAVQPLPPGSARIWSRGDDRVLHDATEDEMADFLTYASSVTDAALLDSEIAQIVREEAAAYFAGDADAAQAARTIQSRVSIRLAEQE